MNSFNDVINIDGTDVAFSFSRMHTSDNDKILVTVFEGNTSFSFQMHKTTFGEWKFIEPLPLWIVVLERQLQQAITTQMGTITYNKETA